MLLTKWGEDLNKKAPLQEYPRPQFVRDSYINLNGEWELEFTKSEDIPEEFSYKITVPFSPEKNVTGWVNMNPFIPRRAGMFLR